MKINTPRDAMMKGLLVNPEGVSRNWVFATNSNSLIPISVQPDDEELWNFELRLFDLTKIIFPRILFFVWE